MYCSSPYLEVFVEVVDDVNVMSVVDVGDDEDGLGLDPPGVQQSVGNHLRRNLDIDVPVKKS